MRLESLLSVLASFTQIRICTPGGTGISGQLELFRGSVETCRASFPFNRYKIIYLSLVTGSGYLYILAEEDYKHGIS